MNFITGSYIFFKKHFEEILFITLGLLILNYLVFYFNIDINDNVTPIKKTTILSTENMDTISDIDSTNRKAFCKTHKNAEELDKSCGELTDKNCLLTQCCVLAHNKENKKTKCVKGGKGGPTYEPNLYDYYHFQKQCYGNCSKKN
jgi:hypothetical protein